MHFPWGWTESSISLELTKTGASGEKLECNGSSVSHRVHASRETQQSCQGSTPHLSLFHSSSNLMHPPSKNAVFAIIDPVRFIFHHHSEHSCILIYLTLALSPFCFGLQFPIGCVLGCWTMLLGISDFIYYFFFEQIYFCLKLWKRKDFLLP